MSSYGMNKNFAVSPSDIESPRSRFVIPYNKKTTCNFGEIVPLFWKPMLPGDTFSFRDMSNLTRMTTPLTPVMDNAYLDTYVFAVPYRLCWDNWERFLGENKLSAWVEDYAGTVPHGIVKSIPGGLLDHMGVPTYSSIDSNGDEVVDSPYLDINVLPFRAYSLIWNRWFRAQTVQDPILVNTGDDGTVDNWNANQALLKAARFPDVFSTALPSPQAGSGVDIPLLGLAPVVYGNPHDMENMVPAQYRLTGTPVGGAGIDNGLYLGLQQDVEGTTGAYFVKESGNIVPYSVQNDYPSTILSTGEGVQITNQYADISGTTAVNISDLRFALAVQRLQELRGRTGSRYQEIILASFGVTVPDARAQEPEFVFGDRVRLSMSQVAQTTDVEERSNPLGRLGAYSQTIWSSDSVPQYTATEHCYIFVVQVARIARTYQQGLNPEFKRSLRYDFFWKEFAHISEQPIDMSCIYADGTASDDSVFGYQEAWWDYRYFPNEVSGRFRSTVANNFDEWHWADYYESVPTFSSSWMAEGTENVARTLAVSDISVAPQLYVDFSMKVDAVRILPLYSIPGLVEHF